MAQVKGGEGTNLGFDGLAADGATTAPRILGLLVGTVHDPETLETLLELGGEALVGFHLRGEERVTTGGRLKTHVRTDEAPPRRSHTWSRTKKNVVPAGCFS